MAFFRRPSKSPQRQPTSNQGWSNSRSRRPRFETLENRCVLAAVTVSPGIDTLQAAIDLARSGDTLLLSPGLYQVSDTVEIRKNLTIRGMSEQPDAVNIVPIAEGFLGDHILSAFPVVNSLTFANFSVKGGAEGELESDPVGDGINVRGVEDVTISNVQSGLNAGNGIYITGALRAVLDDIISAANDASGVDISRSRTVAIRDSQFIGNGENGIEATGDESVANLTVSDTRSTHNAEHGVAVESFRRAALTNVTSSDNGEDGFGADAVSRVVIVASTFNNNLDDGIEFGEVGNESRTNVELFGNRDQRIERVSDAGLAQQLAAEPLPPIRTLSEIVVSPGLDTLQAAVDMALSGDTLLLEPGLYLVSTTVEIRKDLTIQGLSSRNDQVHIVPIAEDFSGDHILSVFPEAERVSFANFTVKGAPDFEISEEECGCDNPSEENGDGIHTDGAEFVTITNVQASLNGGSGIFVNGAIEAVLDQILAVANMAFGVDIETALNLTMRDSQLIANGISGLEASGHDRPDIAFTATATITNTIALVNGEIGIEVERFARATFRRITCAHNVEDGFDADRVNLVAISNSTFAHNLDDGLELFPVDVPVFPPDFPTSIVEEFEDLTIVGNRDQAIEHPPTED